MVALAVALALPAASAPTAPAAAPGLDSALARALRASGVAQDRTAAIAVDLRTGETVYGKNIGRSLLPASAEKLAVSFTALRVLGPHFRFRTEVVGVGSRSGRVWHGNLGLVGYGDPTLTRADLDRLARRFAATGIRRIAGRVFGDDTHFDMRRDGLGWKSSYLGIESPPLSALVNCWSPVRRRERLSRRRCSRVHGSPGATRHRRQRARRLGQGTGPVAHHRLRPLGAAVADRASDGRGQ